MTEHPPSRNPTQVDVAGQELRIEGSRVENTAISQAGRDSYKAGGNITTAQYLQNNYYVQKVISYGSKNERDLDTIKELERTVKSQYSEKFIQVSEIVGELRAQIEKQLDMLPESYQDKSLKLLNDLQTIVSDENDIDDIREELKIYRRASNWLYGKVDHLINIAAVEIFSGKHQHLLKSRRNLLGIPRIREHDIHSIRIQDRFSNDLNAYLGWILSYMPNGSNPKNFNSSFVDLDFEATVYRKAFEIIKSDGINPEISGLSINEARIISRYINKFIIDRAIDKDAS